MDAKYSRKSGQIPAFGDWENANEMPITQYFECARQAGLSRCSCCSGECGDLYGVASDNKTLPRRVYALPQTTNSTKQLKRAENSIDRRSAKNDHYPKQRRKSGNIIVSTKSSITVKPVDEDLYKISPELVIKISKRKKMLRFFSKCIAPPCVG